MISRPTVLILGAGASHPYRFPLGPELVERTLQRLSSKTEALPIELEHLGVRSGDVEEFRERLRYSGLNSLDAFLEGNSGESIRIGKAIIASEIMKSEYEQVLFDPAVQGHWYQYLWNQMRAGVTLADLKNRQLAVITFNYDVSFERYFTVAIKNTFNLRTLDEASKLFESAVTVVHVHGDVASSAYGAHESPLPAGLLQRAADRIKVVHDDLGATPEFDAARALIAGAQVVCFLGFSYHPTNVKRLQVQQHLPDGVPLFGSTFNLGSAEVHRAQSHLGLRTQFGGFDALRFLREMDVL